MSLMLTLHIVFLLIWSAALLYFPHLLAQQACAEDAGEIKNAIQMQRMLYALLMTPSALLTVAAGSWLIFERGFVGGWLHVKLALVLLMVVLHVWCGAQMAPSMAKRVCERLWLYRLLPAAALILITGVVTLVVAKPF